MKGGVRHVPVNIGENWFYFVGAGVFGCLQNTNAV
ncbi:unnamed protein product, partial [marine sediment metagenome]